MIKLLILFPFIAFAAVVGGALLVPLIAIVPLLFVLAVGIALPLLVLRLVFAVLFGLGHLFMGLLGAAAMFVGIGLVLVVGVIGAHLLLPILLILGFVWLVRRASRTQPPQLEHRPA